EISLKSISKYTNIGEDKSGGNTIFGKKSINTMLRLAILFLGLGTFSSCKSEEPVKPAINMNDFVVPPPKEYTFATTPFWADEFEKDGLPDASKWGYDVGNS
ncbi:MAG: hypothetical protein RIR57_1500, partial [Bacteroidota bacterium]